MFLGQEVPPIQSDDYGNMEDLIQLADLIKARNTVASKIATLIGRPALVGHIGEYIASRIFGIALEESASQKGIDGHFIEGQLAGHSVNVKWYTKQESSLDLAREHGPDFYLILAGPISSETSSRGSVRPWVIKTIHLFDARELVSLLRSRGVKIGEATSVRQQLWSKAEIYPIQRNTRLVVTDKQCKLLALFQ